MSAVRIAVHLAPPGLHLPDLVNSTGLAGGTVVGDGTWLTIGEVLARLRDAGYTDSESTIRRMIDDGRLKSHRTERGGHRRIKATSVDKLIASRVEGEQGESKLG